MADYCMCSVPILPVRFVKHDTFENVGLLMWFLNFWLHKKNFHLYLSPHLPVHLYQYTLLRGASYGQ